MLRKLKSKNGESIGEVLVAMLIVALGSVLFATMVTTSGNMITKSDKTYQEYIADRNRIESVMANDSQNSAGAQNDNSVDATITLEKVSEETENNSKYVNITFTGSNENISLYTTNRFFIYRPRG